jgi:hypothetical protein
MARFNYLVVVGGVVDDEVFRSDTAFAVGDVVPFRGDNAVVELIEELDRAAWGAGVSVAAEADLPTAIFKLLHCRLIDECRKPRTTPCAAKEVRTHMPRATK